MLLSVLWQIRLWRRDRQRLEHVKLTPPVDLPPDTPAPLVSVLLPAWNEADSIGPCIESIQALRYANKQVIVCAGGDDGTLVRARQYADNEVIVLEQRPGEGKQRALRRCYAQAAGEIIFLTDADCLLDDTGFERTLAPLLTGGEAAATGTWRPYDHLAGRPLVDFQWSSHVYRELWMGEYADSLDGRNAAIRRDVLDDVGGFVLDASIGTDFVLSRQLEAGGYPIRFVRGSRVRTEYPVTIATYWRQLSRWFRNPLLLGWEWRNMPLVAGILRAGLSSLGLLLALLVVVVTRSKALLSIWLAAGVYLWLGVLRQGMILRADGQASKMQAGWSLRFAVYLPVGWLAVVRGLVDVILPWRRSIW